MWPHLKVYAILSLLTCTIVVGVGAWKFPQVQEGFGLLWKDLITRIG